MDDDSNIDLPDRIDRRKSEYQGQNIQIFMSDDEPPDGKLHISIYFIISRISIKLIITYMHKIYHCFSKIHLIRTLLQFV